MLGRHVVREVRNPEFPASGADQDDRPAVRVALEVRDGGLGGEEDTAQVDSDDLVPCPLADVLGRGERHDTGIRDDDVEAPELGHPRVHGGPHARPVADVDMRRDDPSIELLDQGDRLLQVRLGPERIGNRGQIRTDVDGDDVGALLRQGDRVTAPLAAGRAGDEGDLAVVLSHDRLPI